MKVLIVEPGKYPREADIEHTLEAEQAVVGGTIEAVYPWRDSACIVCNDNGIAENLPLNRMLGDYDIIHGTFFVCGLTRDDFTDLTPKQTSAMRSTTTKRCPIQMNRPTTSTPNRKAKTKC